MICNLHGVTGCYVPLSTSETEKANFNFGRKVKNKKLSAYQNKKNKMCKIRTIIPFPAQRYCLKRNFSFLTVWCEGSECLSF